MVGVVLVTHLIRIWLFDSRGGNARKTGGAARTGTGGTKRQPAGGRKKSGRK